MFILLLDHPLPIPEVCLLIVNHFCRIGRESAIPQFPRFGEKAINFGT